MLLLASFQVAGGTGDLGIWEDGGVMLRSVFGLAVIPKTTVKLAR